MSASLDSLFYPTSVAIVGASPGKPGQLFLDSVMASDFGGNVYPINPRGEEVSGLTAYANVKDVPGTIDYVVCCIPAAAVPQLIRDCAAKGTKAVAIFTAGFSESETEEGKRLEMEISRLAHASGVRIIGPNCLGVYSPKVGLSFTSDFPKESGRVAFVCQSGGNSTYAIRAAAYRGVRFSKAISYGNACDINECELLEYFAQDAETEVVAVYIEGVKDGRRFCRSLRELSQVKPVVVLKAEPQEKFFNVSVCRGKEKFVLLVESNDPAWPAFTFKYFVSEDLLRWARVFEAVYGRDKYVGGPALYFEDGTYYTLYLHSLGGGRYETRWTRREPS